MLKIDCQAKSMLAASLKAKLRRGSMLKIDFPALSMLAAS